MKITTALKRKIIEEHEAKKAKVLSEEMSRRGKLGGAVNKKKGSEYFRMIRQGKRSGDN